MKWLSLLVLFFASQANGFSKPRVVATINIIADMASQVAGNQLDVVSLLPAGTDPHTYEPTPGDASTIAKAQLILTNGLHLEGWLEKLISSAGSKATVAPVSKRVKPITASEFQNSFDPHAWMDIGNAKLYVQEIDSVFSALYPEFSSLFHANAQVYLQKLESTDKEIRHLLAQIPEGQRYLITSHDAFRYFSKAYDFQVASIMGTSTDADVSLKDINHLIAIVKTFKVPAIFVEVAINPKTLQQLAKDLGVVIGGRLFTDSFGPKGSDADSYIAMMLFNATLMKNALANVHAPSPSENWDNPLGLVLVVLVAFTLAYRWAVVRMYPDPKSKADWKNYRIEIENLSVMLGRKMILSNIFLHLEPGKLYGMLGSNGSGKSTLVKTMVGLYKPLTGKITLHGLPIQNFARKIAYLPQKEEFDMDFPATVLDVVNLGFFPNLTGLGQLSKSQKEQALRVMDQLEISHLSNRQIAQLSGGQFQRTLLARAICQEAEIFILDEPFVGVDHATEEVIISLLKGLAKDGKLVLIVHHDLTKVRSYFDHLVMINQRIVAFGPVDDVFTEENIQATYSGKVTLFQKALQLVEHKNL